MAPKIVNRQEKQETIVVAAIHVFALKGFDRTRMEDIAKAAKVGKGTIYEYFSDKESLMNASFDFLFTSMNSEADPGFESSDSAPEKLRKFTLRTVEAVEQLGHTYGFFLEYLLHLNRTGEKYEALEKILVGFRALLASIIEEGKARGEFRSDIQSEQAAASFAAWFDGAIFHVMISPGISVREMATHFLDMVLNGFVRQSPKLEKGLL